MTGRLDFRTAALLTIPPLRELPRLYHAIAFLLIVGGIVVSSRRPPPA